MKLNAAVAFIFLWALDETASDESGNLTLYREPAAVKELLMNVHSRKKRYIVFPKGSSLQILLEVLVHVPTGFRVVVGPTLQLAWPLSSDFSEDFRQEWPQKATLREKIQNLIRFSSFYGFLVYCNTYLFRPVVDIFRFGMTVGLAWQLPDDPTVHRDLNKKHKIYKRNIFKKMEAFLRPGGANGRQCVLKALCESGQRTPSKKDFLREILHKIFSVDGEEEDFEENHEDKIYRKAHDSVNQNCETLYPECQFSVFSAIQ